MRVAGLVLVRQRPGTAKGICFMTIEDETGDANLVVFENLFEKYPREILESKLIMAEGHLQVEGEVIYVIVNCCYNLSKLLGHLTPINEESLPLLTLSHSDQQPVQAFEAEIIEPRKKSEQKIFPKGRNFK